MRRLIGLELKEVTTMSKIIYLKDILLAKPEKNTKKIIGRPKLKPFKPKSQVRASLLKSSLVEKKRKEDEHHMM